MKTVRLLGHAGSDIELGYKSLSDIEKNEFNDNYFLESLFQWKPDPYTIFYAGGSQYFDENNDNFKIMLSQIYIKYQYFFRY